MLPHKQNLETKIEENYKEMRNFFTDFMKKYYLPWNKKNMGLIGNKKEYIIKRIKWFEQYLKQIDLANLYKPPNGMKKNWITPQSKFRSSALEEFVYYLLKDIDSIRTLGLKFSNKNVFVGLSINSKGMVIIKKKDVDLALVKEEKFSIGSMKGSISIPVVAIEVKTYLDKTMWNEAQFAAQIIKRGNPLSNVYVVAETNAVSIEELQPDSPVDEIFILRGDRDSKINANTALAFVQEVENVLRKIEKSTDREPPGRLLHPDI